MSTWGDYFQITTYGESHYRSVGCIVNGCPPGMALTEEDIQPQMTQHHPGQSALTTPHNEKDRIEIQSGTECSYTLRTPIAMIIRNEDQRPKDYGSSTMDLYPHLSHTDYTYLEKYGVKASSGGGLVAAGTIAKKYLKLAHNVEIVSFISSVRNEHLFPPSPEHPSYSTNPEFLKLIETIDHKTVDKFIPVRCPNAQASEHMAKVIETFRDNHDSIGSTVMYVIRNIPIGLGEPAFNKLEAKLGHAIISIPTTKGFEISSGFGDCEVPRSIHNNPFIAAPEVSESKPSTSIANKSRLTTSSNNSGGIQDGISNGATIYFHTAFKPPATISQAQTTTTYTLEEDVLKAKGHHDPCVVPRAVPIIEAIAALMVMDALMAQNTREASRNLLPPLPKGLPIKPETSN